MVKVIGSGSGGGGSAAPHGEAISSLEYLAQIRGTIFSVTEGVPIASATWLGADVALYMPFIVRKEFVVKQFRLANGGTLAGNVDLGIYDSTAEGLPQTLQDSTGSTAHAGANDVQLFNVSNIALSAGLYYMAAALSSASATVVSAVIDLHTNFTTLDRPHSLDGVFEEASALPLPATATPVVMSGLRQAPLMYVGRHQF